MASDPVIKAAARATGPRFHPVTLSLRPILRIVVGLFGVAVLYMAVMASRERDWRATNRLGGLGVLCLIFAFTASDPFWRRFFRGRNATRDRETLAQQAAMVDATSRSGPNAVPSTPTRRRPNEEL